MTSKPLMLTVVMVQTFRSHLAQSYDNSYMPYEYRTVHVPLTPEQMALLEPREVGTSGGKPVCEERGNVWLEAIHD